MVQGGERGVIHLHREGSFYRAYEWSAYLSCRYLHEFKVNKRAFNGIEKPVAYIGFPETSIFKFDAFLKVGPSPPLVSKT